MTFETFVESEGRRLRAGLVAAFGPDVGMDAAAEALAYGWEHWDRVAAMTNPVGYLFRVGQTAARRARRRPALLLVNGSAEPVEFEPRLLPALEQLSESQRICVLLVHAFGWRQVEVAELLGIDSSSVRTHVDRAIRRLRAVLEVTPDVHR